MRFERQPTANPESIKIKVWQDDDDGAHGGEYIGEIESDDEGQLWYVPAKDNLREYVLSSSDLRELASYMDKLEHMPKPLEINGSKRFGTYAETS